MTRARKIEGVGLVAIVALGAGLRLWAIDAKTLWLDEAFSIWVADQALPELVRFVASVDHHPPLYYVLLHAWQMALGDSAGAVRSLSALLGIATIPLFYAAGKRLTDAPTALIGALLLAVSPFHVRYGQEARMYTLMTFTAAGALFCLAVYLVDSRAGSVKRVATMTGLAVTQALLMLSHNTAALLFPAALNAGVLLAYFMQRRTTAEGAGNGRLGALREAGFWRGWMMVAAAAVLLWLPWGPAFAAQAQTVYQEFWIEAPTGYSVWLAFHNFNLAFPEGWFPGSPWWDLLYWGLALRGLWALRRRGSAGILLAALFVAPAALELLFCLRRPVFYDRTLIWTTLPYYLLVAAGVAALWGQPQVGRPRGSPLRGMAAGLALIGLSAFSLLAYYGGYVKEDWRGAAEFVGAGAEAGDVVLFNAPWAQIAFDYYYRQQETPVEMRGAPVDLFTRGELEPAMRESDLPALRELVAGRATVWLVYAHEWYTDAGGLILQELGREMQLADEREFYGPRVFRYER